MPKRKTKDTIRLDWLEKHNVLVNVAGCGSCHVNIDGEHFYGRSYREAIDTAKRVTQKK